MNIKNNDFKKIVSYLKDKGFVYSGSEIYGGLSNTWDYGPLGIILKDNIKKLWENHYLWKENNNYKFDSPIIINSKVWKSSGHIDKFYDPVIKLLNDNTFYRVDSLLEEYKNINFNDISLEKAQEIIENDIKISPYKEKTKWGKIEFLKLMFEVSNSKLKDENDKLLYLRPETAQGIFINFNNFINTIKNLNQLPFGIGQIGKAFRNEVTPKNFIYKTKEFEQMELEYFVTKNDETKAFEKYEKITDEFLTLCNIKTNNIIKKDVGEKELAHYSKRTLDYEYKFPFGEGELLGIANRGDFDLKNHSINSGIELKVNNNDKDYPSVIETSIGVERLMLAIINENLVFDKENTSQIQYLDLPFDLSPYKFAVMPLIDIFKEDTNKFLEKFKQNIDFPILYLEKGTIGKRYKYADSIGTVFVITIDGEYKENNIITIRNRNDKKQIKIDASKFLKKISKNNLFVF